MSLSTDYRRQFGWRDWPSIFNALPPLDGRTLLDLGCGVGDQAALFVTRAGHRSVAKVYCCIAGK